MKSLSDLLFAILLMPIIILLIDTCSNTQNTLIKDAREHEETFYYIQYLDKYPNGKYKQEAYDSIVSLFKKGRYNHTNDIEVMYTVAKKYPNTTLEKELKSLAYDKAVKDNTITIWKNYISIVDESDLHDANMRLDSLNGLMWGTEVKAWKTANSTNSISGYEDYLERYPKGKHSSMANKRLIDLEVDRVFRGDHGTLPNMTKDGYTGGGSSHIYVGNETQYTLTLLYSGTESKKLVILPYSNNSIRLKNGQYRISAMVDELSVRPYAGKENIQGSDYSVKYYIQTTRY